MSALSLLVVDHCMDTPVSHADVSSVIRGYAANVDNDSEDDEAGTGDDLDEADDELDLAVSPDAEDLDDDQQDKQRNDPSGVADSLRSGPVVNLRYCQR